MLRSLFDTRGHVEPCRWLARQPPCGGRQPPCGGQAPKKALKIPEITFRTLWNFSYGVKRERREEREED